MKRKPGMKTLALLLTAGMLFTGCGGRAGNTSEEEPETGGSGKTMGRYMEEAVGMPEDMMRNAGITRLTDGSLSSERRKFLAQKLLISTEDLADA